MLRWVQRSALVLLGICCSISVSIAQPFTGVKADHGDAKRVQGVNCDSGKVPILILGTFHMDGPGEDAVSMVTDMTTPQRQKEIDALIDQLAAFAPTKIAIEAGRNTVSWNNWYTQWLKGEYKLGGNEIEQIGFKLAKRLGMKALYPVDYPMWMNGLTPIERHTPKSKPQVQQTAASPEPESPLVTEIQRQVSQDEGLLKSSTLSRYLVYLNSPPRRALNHRWDVISNLAPGDGVALYENTDLAANWYKRNLRIVTNLLEITEPNDRLLLIIGSGHAEILSSLVSPCPQFCLIPVDSVLK